MPHNLVSEPRVSYFGGVSVVYGPAVIAVSVYLSLPSPRGPDTCGNSLPRSLLRLQFQQNIVEMTWNWKDSAGSYNGYDLARTLRAAAASAQHMGLSLEQAILERTRTRGEFVLRRFMCPAVTGSLHE